MRGVGRKSASPRRLDPRPSHSQVFSSPERILKPLEGLKICIPTKLFNKINATADDRADEPANSASFIPFLSQPDLPGLPTPNRSCLRCGKPVAAPKRAGRPRRFCSDQCRYEQAAEQRSRWTATHADALSPEALRCWSCGEAFPAPAARRGRLPRFCSVDCKRSARRDLNAAYRFQKRRLKGMSDA